MDFDTLQKKLNNGKYHSMDDVAADVDLIFRNCRQFNPPGTDPVIAADAVERAFQREWARILPKRISPNDKRTLLSFITKLRETEM
jgi:transcription initiation factor TFIID subunit 2